MPEIGDSRDLALLRRWAKSLSKDLARNLGEAWSCEVSDRFEVTVTDGNRRAVSRIELEINEDYFRDDSSGPDASDLDGDAAEAVGDAVLDGLQALRVDWPRCPVHERAAMSVCSGVWACSSEEPHDIPVGELHAPPG